jgi:hypothetical protein
LGVWPVTNLRIVWNSGLASSNSSFSFLRTTGRARLEVPACTHTCDEQSWGFVFAKGVPDLLVWDCGYFPVMSCRARIWSLCNFDSVRSFVDQRLQAGFVPD